jgi:two-component system, NtrC family, response regulator AtoC
MCKVLYVFQEITMVATSVLKPELSTALHDVPPDSVIFGRSEAMREVRRRIERLAGANIPVLLQGESGTGKEILSKLFHQYSPWSKGPFVKVNCPAIPGTLLESELFGYERGAFTGAVGSKPGRVEMAHRGTLFLDEISEMSFDLQSKLLQLLQDGQFCRIGAQEDRRVEVRVVCATNRDLQAEVAAGRFRQDLFYRIAVATIQLPPLRERRDDIPDIVNYLLVQYREKYNTAAPPLSSSLMAQLQRYSWPGNIRELENLIRRFVILGTEDAVSCELDSHSRETLVDELIMDGDLSLKTVTRRAVAEIERKLILKVLQNNNWNRKKTANILGISYRALLYKIQAAGLPPARSRPDAERRPAQSA